MKIVAKISEFAEDIRGSFEFSVQSNTVEAIRVYDDENIDYKKVRKFIKSARLGKIDWKLDDELYNSVVIPEHFYRTNI